MFTQSCEQSYETLESTDSSGLIASQACANALNLKFCYDIRGAQGGFMSANQRGSAYFFKNERVSKEIFEDRMRSVDTGSYQNFQKYLQEFTKLRRKSVHHFANIRNAEDVTGYTIKNSRNCHSCFWVSDLENCKYVLYVNDAKDAMDVNNGCCVMSLQYEVCTTGVNASNIKFSVDTWPEVTNITYSDSCRDGADNLFGCVSLRKSKFCILNKQYTREEYQTLIPRIIDQMQIHPYADQQGRVYSYGEFFPTELSPYAYNDSKAQEHFPLSQQEAEKRGLVWHQVAHESRPMTRKSIDLPDHINNAPETITKDVIGCAHDGDCDHRCSRVYIILPQELRFYRTMNLPLPRLCPNCRYHERLSQLNPIHLWPRQCMCAKTSHATHTGPCPAMFQTSYAPDRPEIVYCEPCYQSEVI